MHPIDRTTRIHHDPGRRGARPGVTLAPWQRKHHERTTTLVTKPPGSFSGALAPKLQANRLPSPSERAVITGGAFLAWRSDQLVWPGRLLASVGVAVLAGALLTALSWWRGLPGGGPFGRMEGLEGLAGRVVVGGGADGGADAVPVELLPHRAQDVY